MRGLTAGVATMVWSLVQEVKRSVNVKLWNGVAPAALSTVGGDNLVQSDARGWAGGVIPAPATNGVPRVAIEQAGDFAQAAADKVWATAARTLTTVPSPIQSITYYSGTSANVPGTTTMDVDVALSPSTVIAKTILIPASLTGGVLTLGGHPTAVLTAERVEQVAVNTVRFKNVTNGSGVAAPLSYAFWVVEFR